MASRTVQNWNYKHFEYKQIDVSNKHTMIKYVSENISFSEISYDTSNS